MSWLPFDPLLSVALLVVIGWFLAAICLLCTLGRRLLGNITTFTDSLARPGSGEGDKALDSVVPPGSELAVTWRRVKAARFISAKGRLALRNDPTDLVTPDDVLDPTKWYRFCSATPNYLVGLGLGFTFLGLVLALGSIDPRNLNDPEQLTSLFGAMKLKFVASMAGIFLSIFSSLSLRFYLAAVQHRVRALQDALASRYPVIDPVVDALMGVASRVEGVESRITESIKVAARTADATEQSLDIWGNVVEQLNAAATQLKQFNDELSISIGNVLEERFEHKLLPPISEALKSLERAVHGVRDAQTAVGTDTVTSMVEQFRNAVAGGATAEVTAITSTLTQLNDSLTATKEDLHGVGRTIEANVVSGLKGATTELARSIEALSHKLADTLNAASGSLVTRLDAVTEDAGSRFTKAVDRLDTLLHDARGTVDAGVHSAQGTERLLAKFSDIAAKLDEVQVGLSRIAEPVQRASDKLDAAADRVRQASEAIERSAQHSQTIEERVSASWTQASQRFEGVDAELAKLFSDLNAGLVSYAATVNEFNGKLTHEFTRALGSLQGIVGELDETLQEMKAQVRGVGAQ